MLANANLPNANSPTAIYTSPATGTRTVFSVSFNNRGGAATTVSLFLVGAGSGADASNAIEFSTPLPATSTLERTGLVLKAGQSLWASCGAANVSAVVVYGIEE